ncbi:hypothetical protein SK128_022998, partial [Halocaridina rubra]
RNLILRSITASSSQLVITHRNGATLSLSPQRIEVFVPWSSSHTSTIRSHCDTSPTSFAAIHSVAPSARYFIAADALCGYWQMELGEEDLDLTTFITPQ